MTFTGAGLAAVVVFLCVRTILAQPPRKKGDQPENKTLFTYAAPVLRLLVPVVSSLMWPQYRQWLERRLDAAGIKEQLAAEEFFAFRFLAAAVLWFATAPFAPGLRLLALLFALVFPELWLSGIIQDRHAQIRRNLPYFVDILSLCASAGLELGAAIDRVLARIHRSPLTDEFRIARRDVQLGMSQQEALLRLGARVQMPELLSFTAILVQAVRMGASVADILEAQAEKMRLERYEQAERLGTQAQQKLLIPLLLLILPAFVLMGIVPIMIALLKPILEGGGLGVMR
ncbi:MAG: type II secretion system F family protein [Lentisphaerae bacterium]|nr:type II secretion system F family protein [Lentisphaerota bacterium]